ncbi:hypothetical protein SLA2020_426840 [Shorea laevis]
MAGIGWLAQSGIRTGRIVRRGGQSWCVNWQNKAGISLGYQGDLVRLAGWMVIARWLEDNPMVLNNKGLFYEALLGWWFAAGVM